MNTHSMTIYEVYCDAIQLGDLQGARTDLELPANCPEVEPDVEAGNIAVNKAGFGDRTASDRGKEVAEPGALELFGAVDAGEISISVASLTATRHRTLTPTEIDSLRSNQWK